MMDQKVQDVVTGAGKTVEVILGVHIVFGCIAERTMSKDPDCPYCIWLECLDFASARIRSTGQNSKGPP